MPRTKSKNIGKKRLNPSKMASVKRQGASAGTTPQIPKRVLNHLASAKASLEKAASFFESGISVKMRFKKKKLGRPKKNLSEQSTPA